MGSWHGVCGTPGHHDRSGDLDGSAGGCAGSGASAPSAGGSPPPDAAYTSVAAHFNSAMAARWAVSCSCGWVTVAETIIETAALVEAHANRCGEPSEHLITIRGPWIRRSPDSDRLPPAALRSEPSSLLAVVLLRRWRLTRHTFGLVGGATSAPARILPAAGRKAGTERRLKPQRSRHPCCAAARQAHASQRSVRPYSIT